MDRPLPLAALRQEYTRAGLSEADLAPTWPEQFAAWFAEAQAAQVTEPNAVVLATASPDGRPSARTVLVKGVDRRGFVVFTNLSDPLLYVGAGYTAVLALAFDWVVALVGDLLTPARVR